MNCTEASHRCSIQWQPPRTSHVDKSSCFKYEIVIENKVRIIVSFNNILFVPISIHNTIQPVPCSHPLLLKVWMTMESNITSFKNKAQNICLKKKKGDIAKLNVLECKDTQAKKQ